MHEIVDTSKFTDTEHLFLAIACSRSQNFRKGYKISKRPLCEFVTSVLEMMASGNYTRHCFKISLLLISFFGIHFAALLRHSKLTV